MPFVRGSSLPQVRASNRSSILQMIYHCGPIKRSDIARELGLTLPTITTSVSELMEAGIVREVDLPGHRASLPGRRARPVDVIPNARYFAGVEMQGFRRVVAVTDFRGSLLYTKQDCTFRRDYSENIQLSAAMLAEALAYCSLVPAQLCGVGLCAPGLVNAADGMLDTWPNYGWHSRPLRQDFIRATGLSCPVSVENNACARAYGARLDQRETVNDAKSFAYFFISNGTACPLFMNTPNAFGSVVGAGEVGHMVIQPGGELCHCGNRGCLDAYASNQAVISACTALVAQGRAPVLAKLCPGGRSLTMDAILAAQDAGDSDVVEAIRTAVFHLGIAVANVINFSCPQVMFLDGQLFRRVDNQSLLLQYVRQNMCNVVRTDTRFIFLHPNDFSGAHGAAALAICKYLQRSAE